MLAPWREVLLDAARYLKKHGWCKGTLRDAEGKTCAWGAMVYARSEKYSLTVDFLEKPILDARMHIQKHIGCAVTTWNDHKCRSRKQVIETLVKAANDGLKVKRTV